MTTYTERNKIEADAQADPAALPPGSTQQEVDAAKALLSRIRQGLFDVAVEVLVTGSEDREKVGWARRVLSNPPDTFVMRILLAHFDNLTVTQVLGASDTAIHDALLPMVERLALGFNVNSSF